MTQDGRLSSASRPLLRADSRAVEWRVSNGLVPYETALAAMEARAEAIARGKSAEQVWLLEHPPLYTAGTSARDAAPTALPFPLHVTGRGGQLTYHGPGQRVAYVMLDLARRAPDLRAPDLRAYVAALEGWIIDTLAAFNVLGERREERVGVWVRRSDKAPGLGGAPAQREPAEDKIAAIGIRIRRWVSFHGIALNVEPDLSHFTAITPCGISASHFGVTSLVDLGHLVTMADVDAALAQAFVPIFGPIARPTPR